MHLVRFAAAALLLPMLACTSALQAQPDSLPLEEVHKVVLDAYDARVLIRSGDLLELASHVEWKNRRSRPVLEHEVIDGVLYLTGACDPTAPSCVVEHTLSVPDHVAIELLADTSEVQISGSVGSVSGELIESELDLVRLTERVDLVVANTPITGSALRAKMVRLTSSGGDVSLDFAEAPDLVDVSAQGDVRVLLPSGPYDLDLRSESGPVFPSGIPHDRDAERSVRVHTRSGSVSVQANR